MRSGELTNTKGNCIFFTFPFLLLGFALDDEPGCLLTPTKAEESQKVDYCWIRRVICGCNNYAIMADGLITMGLLLLYILCYEIKLKPSNFMSIDWEWSRI